MAQRIFTHLMFTGRAEEAINLYMSAFEDSELISMSHYPNEHATAAGKVEIARFRLLSNEYIAIDSPIPHDFDFTPSMSIFVEFEDENEMLAVLGVLHDGSTDLMPLDNYGFSEKFVWFKDRFGVSWQLNLN